MKYCNRHGRPFAPELVRLARISPGAYAEKIRARNQDLLATLMAAQHRRKSGEAANTVAEQIGFVTAGGRPHCSCSGGWFACGACLWRKACGSKAMPCTHALFPCGHSYTTQRQPWGQVVYGCGSARIRLVPDREWPEDGGVLRLFLEDHIDWAGLDCWGWYEKPWHVRWLRNWRQVCRRQ